MDRYITVEDALDIVVDYMLTVGEEETAYLKSEFWKNSKSRKQLERIWAKREDKK